MRSSARRNKITRKKAIKLAIECVEKERHKTIFDANMYTEFSYDTPYSEKCHNRNLDLLSVIDFLNALEPTQTKMEL